MVGGEQQTKQEHAGAWSYRTEGGTTHHDDSMSENAPIAAIDDNAVEWTASEFIVHDKSPLWYVVLGASAVVVAAAIYMLTRDVVSVAVVVILVAVLGVAASRKPRIVAYRVDRGGINVGKQFHPYGAFKSFAVIDEGPFASITFLPMKRFAMPLSIYFSPEDEPKIIDVLAGHLPLEPGELSIIDHLMRNMHF